MTRTQILTDARKAIYETDASNTHFSDDELIAWYEQWHIDIATWSKWPRAEATVAGGSVAEQATYPIDGTKVLEILEVYFNSRMLDTITVEGLNDFNHDWRVEPSSNSPSKSYMADSDVIGIYPKPKTAAIEIRIRYVKIPNPSTSGLDTPDVPVAYHGIGYMYIAARAHRSIGNDDEADRLEKLFMNKKKEIKGAVKVLQRPFGWDWNGAQ